MPLLGLFSKRQKSKSELSPTIDSEFSSPTTEFVPNDKQLPSSPNGGASSSKLHLPFRRKKTSEPASIVSHGSLGSEADLRPPIRTYGDANGALSTRSLPPTTPKRPTFFKWPSTKSNPNVKLPESPPPPLPSPPKIEYRPPPPLVRPRGASVASDSSQRISVAAFREAQAKRSLTSSPVPSLRAPSPGPNSFARSATPRMRVSTLATDSDSDESPDANESDDQSKLGRRNTVTHRKNPSLTDSKPRAARSELGHSTRPPDVPRRSSSSSSSSEDDAPLAKLVAPRRPGSALSQASTPSSAHSSRIVATGKPLIDISDLTGPNRKPLQSGSKPRDKLSLPKNDRDKEAFTSGGTLLESLKSPAPAPPNSNPALLTSKSRPEGFLSPPASPKPIYADPTPLPPPSVGMRKSPMRKDTGDREGIQDRLARVSRMTAGTPPPPAATPPPPTTLTIARGGFLHPDAPASLTSNRVSMSVPPPAFTVDENFSDLASMLGAGVRLISRNGELSPIDSPDSASSSSSSSSSSAEEPPPIAPIPIKKRTPAPSFSVTSRPIRSEQSRSTDNLVSPSQRSSIALSPTTTNGGSPTKPPSWSTSAKYAAAAASSPGSRSSPKIVSPPAISTSPSAPPLSPSGPNQSQNQVGGQQQRRMRSSSHSFAASSPSLSPVSNPAPTTTATPNSRPPARPFIRASGRESPVTSDGSELGSASTPTSPITNRNPKPNPNVNRNLNAKKRSETVPDHLWSRTSSDFGSASSGGRSQPNRPFVTRSDRESPGTSSTGDSVPVTPRDGSDLGSVHTARKRSETIATSPTTDTSGEHIWSGGASGLGLGKGGKHIKRHSVGFEDDVVVIRDRENKQVPAAKVVNEEERRRERRRGEAKAAIELGNVINGRGPVHLDEDDDDEEEDDQPINQTRAGQMMMVSGGGSVPSHLNSLSPTLIPSPMGFSPPANWGGATPGLSPWPMMSPPTPDATFLAAHQQAMMIAKQAYQMAVAQQAMAAAGEQWERGSTMSYGGGAGSPPFGMGMGAMPIGMSSGWSSAGSMIFPSSSQSLYNGGIAQSEYGGGGGNWSSSRSVYGETFGDHRSSRMISPPHNRTSMSSGYFPPPPVPQQQQQSQAQSNRNPRSRTVSQPATPNRSGAGGGVRRAPPPSSWKASGV